MNPPIFFVEAESVSGTALTLNKIESHHASSVLRLKIGAIIIAVDGNGVAYRGEICRIGKSKLVEVTIHAVVRNFGEPNIIVTLAAGLSSGSKFNTVIEKGTEIGVRRFVPLLCEKGKVKIEEPKKIKAKLTRYNKVAMAAMKQCRRSYKPEIVPPTSFQNFLHEIDKDSLNLIFHPSSNAIKFNDLQLKKDYNRITIIVGPESGFSDDEISLALDSGVQAVSLGNRILRTETAGPVISALVMHLFNEFR